MMIAEWGRRFYSEKEYGSTISEIIENSVSV